MTVAQQYNLATSMVRIPHHEWLRVFSMDIRAKVGPSLEDLLKIGDVIHLTEDEKDGEALEIVGPVLAIQSEETLEVVYLPAGVAYQATDNDGKLCLVRDVSRFISPQPDQASSEESDEIEMQREERLQEHLRTTDTMVSLSRLENLIDKTIEDCVRRGISPLKEIANLMAHPNPKVPPLTKWHYDLVVERGVLILDNRFPDDFGTPFFDHQEALGHQPGWKYDNDLLERRRHYFYG